MGCCMLGRVWGLDLDEVACHVRGDDAPISAQILSSKEPKRNHCDHRKESSTVSHPMYISQASAPKSAKLRATHLDSASLPNVLAATQNLSRTT